MATVTAAEGLDRRFDFESTRTETGVTWPNLINTSSPSSVREKRRKGVEAGEKSEKEIKGEKEIKEERDNRNEKVDRAEREIKDEKASSRGTDRMRDMTDSKVNHPYQSYSSMQTLCL